MSIEINEEINEYIYFFVFNFAILQLKNFVFQGITRKNLNIALLSKVEVKIKGSLILQNF